MTQPDATPVASVVIAVKDRRELLAACLEGLERQTWRDFEVVVVDNGSTDGTLDLLHEWKGRTTAAHGMTVRTDLGTLGQVRNAGVAAARGSILAFVDSDCVPADDWMEHGVAPFLAEGGDRISTVQGRTLPDPAIPRGGWDATQELTSFTGRYEACNLFYRRDALVKAGGFDEQVGFFGEDTAAGWAVRRLGMEERFASDAVVHHTVTFPGIRWHWRRGLRYGNWCALVRRFPEMRSLLWRRWFLRPASAETLAAAVGVAAALGSTARRGTGRRALLWLVLSAPFAWRHRPRGLSKAALVDSLGAAGFDVSVEVGLLRGTLQERTVVL